MPPRRPGVRRGNRPAFFCHILLRLDGTLAASQEDPPLIDARTRSLADQDVLHELAVEYCRLFIGPLPACSPYASTQQGEVRLGGQARQLITAFLAERGIAVPLRQQLPVRAEDHIAVSFAVLDHLFTVAAGHGTASLTPQEAAHAASELRNTHLMRWAPDFLGLVRLESRLPPYGCVAGLAGQVLLDEDLFFPIRAGAAPAGRRRPVVPAPVNRG